MRGLRGRLGLLTVTHVVDDFYVGAVPALLPYFSVERHYGYAAIGGVLLAGTLLSCVLMPTFGVLCDRHGFGWMVSAGMLTAGLGFGLAGVVDNYAVTSVAVALSGIGVAAYHPEAAKAARAEAGDSAGGMGVFSVGGNIGLALGSVVVALVIRVTGLAGTSLLAVPAVLMAVVYAVASGSRRGAARAGASTIRARSAAGTAGIDDWRSFRILVAVIIARAIGSAGTGSFVALYVISQFHRSAAIGSLVLGIFSGFGVVGTVVGARLADRIGRAETLRLAYAIGPLAMCGIILLPSLGLALVATAVLGLTWYMPFAVQLVLGQDYLPHRPGTASGMTLGFSITAAGLFTPLLGSLADSYNLAASLWLAGGALVVALGLSMLLPNPSGTPPAAVLVLGAAQPSTGPS